MTDVRVLVKGILFGEQPRWHEGRLWFSDWGTGDVIAADLDGTREVIVRVGSFPCCVDWLTDGRLLVVSPGEGLLLRREPDGTLVTHGDLGSASSPPAGNELVVDGRGNAYVNGGGFKPDGRGAVRTRRGHAGDAGRLGAAGRRRPRFPQRLARHIGQRDAHRGRVLRQATHGVRHRFRRQPLQPAGLGRPRRRRPGRHLPRRRGAVWCADVPNRRCSRVREGGEVLQTIELDRGCFACALGGPDRRTLFMMAQEWNGPENMFAEPRTGQVLMAEAPVAGDG